MGGGALVAVKEGEARGTTPSGEQRLKRHLADESVRHPPVPTTKRHGRERERPSGGEGHRRIGAIRDCIQGLVGARASMTPLSAARPRAPSTSIVEEGSGEETPTLVSKRSAGSGEKTDLSQLASSAS